MTKENAEALFTGINESGATVFLGVPAGGTGNNLFTDQEVLKYDAATGKIISAGFTGVLPGGNSIFIPRETGTLYSSDGVDRTLNDTVEMVLVQQAHILPANSQWSDILIVFQFTLTDTQPTMTGLGVRLMGGDGNLEPTQPLEIISPLSTTLYQAGSTPDTQTVTWVAMGQIPEGHAFDSTLQFALVGVPGDLAPYRSVVVRVSYRGLQPEPAAGGNKGVPVFLNTPVVVANVNVVVPWTTFDISTYVPAGASAVMINAFVRSNQQNKTINVKYRAQSGANEYVLASVKTNNDEDDIDTSVAQMTLPFSSVVDVRSFQYTVDNNPNEFAKIEIIGYIA